MNLLFKIKNTALISIVLLAILPNAWAQNSKIDEEKINNQFKSGGEYQFLSNIITVGAGKCETNFVAVKQTREGVLVEINPPEISVGERSCSFRQLELLIGGDVLPLKYLDKGFKQIPDGGYKWHTDVPAALFFAGQENRTYSKTELMSLGIRDAFCSKDTTDCLNSGTQVATPAPATSFTKAPVDINSPKVTQQAIVMPPAPKVAVANAIADALSLNDPTVTAHIKANQAGKANDESVYLRMPRQFSVTTDQGDLYGFKEEDASNGNMTDKVLIAPTFTTASEFDRQTGIAVACTASEKCGLINTKGQFVVPPLAARIRDFIPDSETGLIDFMPVEDSAIPTKCGFIGFDGKIKISPIFKECGHFYKVNSFGPDGHKNFIAPANVQLADDRWGFILPNGEWAITQLYQEISGSGDDPIAVKRDGLWGYVVANSDGKSMRYLVEPSYRVVGSWRGPEKEYFFWASKTETKLNDNSETDGCLTSAHGFIQDAIECRKQEWMLMYQAPVWLYYLHQWLPANVIEAVAFLFATVILIGGIGWNMLRKNLTVFRWIRFTKTARLLQITIVVIPLAALFAAMVNFTADDPVYGSSNPSASGFGLGDWVTWIVLLAIGALPVSLVFAAISWYLKRRRLAKEKATLAEASTDISPPL